MKLTDKIEITNECNMELMKRYPNNYFDFVLTDPPYELDNHGGVVVGHDLERKLTKDKHIDFISNGFNIENVFNEVERISKTMNFICFCSNKQISKIMSYWENKNYSVTLLVWDKPNPIPLGNGKHISNLEFMIYVRGKGATFNNIGVNEQKKTFNFPSPSTKERIHPTEKPIALIQRLIQIHTNENDKVLDCFGGSMSTAIACINSKREIVSCEINPEIYQQGLKRVQNHLLQQKLF
jgi:site-specific DNA-methyltransferase (adenine-specific)